MKQELEAKLLDVTAGQRVGKLERKVYGDGTQRLKLTVRELGLAGHVSLVARVEGQAIAEIVVVEGSGKFDNEGGLVPEWSAGQSVELCHGDRVLATGKLEVD